MKTKKLPIVGRLVSDNQGTIIGVCAGATRAGDLVTVCISPTGYVAVPVNEVQIIKPRIDPYPTGCFGG